MDYFDGLLYFLSGQGQYIVHTLMDGQKALGCNLKILKFCFSFTGLEHHEGESLMT